METAKETVKERIQDTYRHTRKQFVALEQRARGRMEEVPRQLRGAWDRAATALRRSLDLPGADDLRRLGARLDELGRKVDRLAREKVAKAQDRVVRLTKK